MSGDLTGLCLYMLRFISMIVQAFCRSFIQNMNGAYLSLKYFFLRKEPLLLIFKKYKFITRSPLFLLCLVYCYCYCFIGEDYFFFWPLTLFKISLSLPLPPYWCSLFVVPFKVAKNGNFKVEF